MDASVTELKDAIKQVIKKMVENGANFEGGIIPSKVKEQLSGVIDLEKYEKPVIKQAMEDAYNELNDFYEQSDKKESPRHHR